MDGGSTSSPRLPCCLDGRDRGLCRSFGPAGQYRRAGRMAPRLGGEARRTALSSLGMRTRKNADRGHCPVWLNSFTHRFPGSAQEYDCPTTFRYADRRKPHGDLSQGTCGGCNGRLSSRRLMAGWCDANSPVSCCCDGEAFEISNES